VLKGMGWKERAAAPLAALAGLRNFLTPVRVSQSFKVLVVQISVGQGGDLHGCPARVFLLAYDQVTRTY